MPVALAASGTSHPFLLFNDISETPGYQYSTQSPWSAWQSSVMSIAKTAKGKDFTQPWSGDTNWVSQRGYYAMNLALAYQITKDSSYSDKAKQALLNLDVGVVPATPPMMRPEAFRAMSLLYYCLAYDWVQPTMDPATDTAVRDKLARLADTVYLELNNNGQDRDYISFVDWQGQAYPIMGIAGVTLYDYTNPNGLSLSSDPAEWRRVGTDYLFVNDQLHDYNKPLIAFEVDGEGKDTMGSYKAYYIDDFCWWAQIYTRFYDKNFFDVYPIAQKLLTSEIWESLPDLYSTDFATNGQAKYDYHIGIANLLDPANRSYALNFDSRIDNTDVLPYAEVFPHIYYNSQLSDALPYLVFNNYSGEDLAFPTWTSHLSGDSVYQVFRQSWNDDSDWLSLVTFSDDTTLYSRRNSWQEDQMSIEYYGKGDLLLSDGGEEKSVLDKTMGESELSHNTIAIENPRNPFTASSWGNSPARGLVKGVRNSDGVTYSIRTGADIQDIAETPWLDMMKVTTTISGVQGNSYGTYQSLSSPIQYERTILSPDKDYYVIIDRTEGTQTWGYRTIFRPSSLNIVPTSGNNVGHVNGDLTIGDTPYNWQSLSYKQETNTGIDTNSIRWDTTNPNGKNVELQLYTVPSSPVLLTKFVGRIAGYGTASEVYNPVIQFDPAPSQDLYRATVLLSSYGSDAAMTPSEIAVTGTGNALKIDSSTYTDYVYTGSGTSSFGPYTTDADTAFVRMADKPVEYTLISGSTLQYSDKPVVASSETMDYLTMKMNGSTISVETNCTKPSEVTSYQVDPSASYQVTMDGRPYENWAMVDNSTGINVTVDQGAHDITISALSSGLPVIKSDICPLPISALAAILAVSMVLMAFYKRKYDH